MPITTENQCGRRGMLESIPEKKSILLYGQQDDYAASVRQFLEERFVLVYLNGERPAELLRRVSNGADDRLPRALLFDAGGPEGGRELEGLEDEFPLVPVLRIPLTSPPGAALENGHAARHLESIVSMVEHAISSVAELRAYAPALSLREAPREEPPGLTAEVAVHTLTRADFERWDAFVDSHEHSTFFHRAGWKRLLEEVYHHDAPYLYATRGGEIAGILPLGHIKSPLFGNSLCSTPFCVYGGAVADDDTVRERLQLEACRMAERLGVDYLELRHLEPVNKSWPRKDLHVTFRKELNPDPDVNMKEIPRKQRRMVRQGIEGGLVSEIDHDISRFYPVYAECVRNLGTPVHSKRYFLSLKEVFGEECEMMTVLHQGRVLSSVLSFYFKDEVLPYYGGGGLAAREHAANDFMYWELMRRACERGIRVFDFGRSKKGVGSYSFKKHWGFVEEPLNYEFHLVRATELPDVNPLNPKYQLFISMWKRLPLPVSKLIGPFLAKDLG